ncbi:MAG: peptidylprolyl isomerase [Rhodobacteraceae bacterium]|nr:peptidylprolyl isomerase [Paracoccaceae bacterium]
MTPAPACPARPRRRSAALGLAVALLTVIAVLAAPVARAQSMFAAALYVNDEPITNYEITQKMRFLQFIGAAGDNPRERAIERLIEDRLQLQEVQRLGGRLTPDQINAGMSEFAARANLTAEEMLDRMQRAGVDRETFVSFIRSGLLWRELIRTLYGSQVSITDAQIDQALSIAGLQPVTEVLISEIFLPSDAQFAQQVERIIPQIQRIRTETEFANAARQVSAAPSGPSGGRVDRWINVSAMPPEVASVMGSAAVGAVIGPIEVPGAHAFFQLRARREARSVQGDAVELDYRRVDLPGAHSDANQALVAHVRDTVDSCADFPATVLRAMPTLPESAVAQLAQRQPEVPATVRAELERLNPGQISANLVENGNLVLLMLCNRRIAEGIAPSRDDVRMSLVNRALEGQAAVYLQRLRAEAEIRYP